MGREEGGGFRMGNTCIPVADSFQYLTKLTPCCKVKKKKKSLEGYSLWGHKRVGHNSVLNNNNMVCGSWVFGVLRF